MLGSIARFLKIGRNERRLFFFACLVSAKCSLITLILPIRRYAHRLGEKGKESPRRIPENQLSSIEKVRRSIIRVDRYTPWRKTCFTKAFTAKILLKRANIPSTLYLGVAKDSSNNMIAHAWLRCGDLIITGKEQMPKFTPVAFFT